MPHLAGYHSYVKILLTMCTMPPECSRGTLKKTRAEGDMPNSFTDPFGAPEYFCNNMVLETLAPGMVWCRMLYRKAGEQILRCTIIMPQSLVPKNMDAAEQFMGENRMMTN